MNTARRQPSAAEVGLVLRLAAHQVSESGWARPLPSDDEIVVAIDGRLTLVGAIHRATGVPVDTWMALADPRLHDVWDALVLALADLLGEWSAPKRGLTQIETVLRWERTGACQQDVVRVLRIAAVLAESAVAHTYCPVCAVDTWRSTDCSCCGGNEVLQLHPDRWTRTALRVVR